jgi:two-component system, LytTR family, response regulator
MNTLYKTLIIDDEPPARERLLKLLSHFPETFNILDVAENGGDAKHKIETLKPDLIFLDIEMPGLNGFELLASLETIPIVVFCTAYDQYSLEAFKTNSIDYLVKPVRLERIEKTIQKLKLFEKTPSSQNILKAIEAISKQKEAKKMTLITVKKGEKLIFLQLDKVSHFEAKEKYVNIYYKNEIHLSELTLLQLEQKLPDYFLRIQKSVIINKNYVNDIQKYFNSRFIITLKDNKQSSVTSGRSYNDTIKEWIAV